MNDIIVWVAWFASIGMLYIGLLYLFYLRSKDEQKGINLYKNEPDLHNRIRRIIQEGIDNPKEPKNFRDLYVFDKNDDKINELDKELEQLRKRGRTNKW